jgi:hypothetical protein
MSFTHDGTTDALVEALVRVDGDLGTVDAGDGSGRRVTRLRRLLECCRDVPPEDGWTPAATADLLRAAVPRSSRWWMAYCGYPGRTVIELRALAAAAPEAGWPVPEDDEP